MRSVRLLTYPDAAILEIAAAPQVFRIASLYLAVLGEHEYPYYESTIVSPDGGLCPTTIGFAIDTTTAQLQPVDTFIVPGGSDSGVDRACANPTLIAFVREQARLARRIGVIATGAFILAKAGLLDGRKVTTHWMDADRLAAEFPKIEVERNASYIVDGPYWSAAGMLSGVDLALGMVEQDLGPRIANYTARVLISYVRRAPGEPQLSTSLEAREAELGRIHSLMIWVADNPAADLSTLALAQRSHLSVRSLHRQFQSQTGETPAKFVERTRVQTAQRLLAKTDDNLDAIATASGFGSTAALQRAFSRVLRTTPAQYRKRVGR